MRGQRLTAQDRFREWFVENYPRFAISAAVVFVSGLLFALGVWIGGQGCP